MFDQLKSKKNKMATKKNEPKLKPSAVSSGDTEQRPTQNIPEENLTGGSQEVKRVESTPFDSFSAPSSGSDEGFGAGVWNNNKKVQGLWSKAETRNSWINLTDLGWKKINNPTDTSVTAITIVAACGLETQSPANVLIDNNMVGEIYLW